MPPPGTAPQTMVTMPARMRRGAYSEASATKHGPAPPMPSPVRARTSSRLETEPAQAVSSVASENSRQVAIRKRRRPQRSAHGPNRKAPTSEPHCEAEKIGPSAPRGKCRSPIMSGPVTPIACVSRPSMKAIRKQMAKTQS